MKKSLMMLGAAVALCLGALTSTSLAADPESTTGETNKRLSRAEQRKVDLEKYDANKDGKLDKTERAAMKADKEAQRAAAKAEKEAAKQAKLLAKYDANKNGKLDPEEEAARRADEEKNARKSTSRKPPKDSGEGAS